MNIFHCSIFCQYSLSLNIIDIIIVVLIMTKRCTHITSLLNAHTPFLDLASYVITVTIEGKASDITLLHL